MDINVYQAFYLPAGAGRPAGHINLTIKHQSSINKISKLTRTYNVIK